MHCRNCKHWGATGRGNSLDGPWVGFGTCNRWQTGYAVRAKDLAENEALVESYEGWANVTGPEFGCVLFEKITGKVTV